MAKCNKSLGCAVVAREESEELTVELKKEQSEALLSSQQDWDQAETHRWTTQCHQQTDDKLQEYQPTPSIERFFLPLRYFPFFSNLRVGLRRFVCACLHEEQKNKQTNKKKCFCTKFTRNPLAIFMVTTTVQRLRLGEHHGGEWCSRWDNEAGGRALYRYSRWSRAGDVQ